MSYNPDAVAVSALYKGWKCKDQLPLFERKEDDDGMDRTAHQPEQEPARNDLLLAG